MFSTKLGTKTLSIIESGSFWLKCGSKTNIVWFVFPVFFVISLKSEENGENWNLVDKSLLNLQCLQAL